MIKRLQGFTLIELVVVITIIVILAIFAAPNLNLAVYRQHGFVQQSLASIRYAQKQAIGSGCDVQVTISAAGCNLTWTGTPAGIGCLATPLSNPASGTTNFCEDSDAVAGATFAPAFTFDKIGRPSAGTVQYILGTSTIQVESETGYAREL